MYFHRLECRNSSILLLLTRNILYIGFSLECSSREKNSHFCEYTIITGISSDGACSDFLICSTSCISISGNGPERRSRRKIFLYTYHDSRSFSRNISCSIIFFSKISKSSSSMPKSHSKSRMLFFI